MLFFRRRNKKQLEAIFDWLSSVVAQNELIVLERRKKQVGFIFKFPLKIGDRPKKLRDFDIGQAAFFIGIGASEKFDLKLGWQRIFGGLGIEVWANKEIIKEPAARSLIFGLAPDEKKLLFKIARRSLELFLTGKKQAEIRDLLYGRQWPRLLNMKVDLGLAAWVNGHLRGLSVVKERSLADNIIEAAIAASRDAKFKPIEKEDLESARLEMILFSDLRVPIDENFIKRNRFFCDKGCLIENEKGREVFLPMRFNLMKFSDLRSFLSRSDFQKNSKISIFEVRDFIEAPQRGEETEALDLDGPIVKIQNLPNFEESAFFAADWLLEIQEEDGNFLPIIDPRIGPAAQIDWPRCGLCGLAMAEFGRAVGKNNYTEASRKSLIFLKKYLLDEDILSDKNRAALSLAYFGQLALSFGLNYWQEIKQCALKISQRQNALVFEPILWSQLGSFFVEISKIDRNYFPHALNYAQSGRQIFESSVRQKKEMKLAHWAELANLHLKLFQLTGDSSFLKTAGRTLDWLCTYQMETGAFKATNKSVESALVYTRGVGKIAEVLASVFLLDKNIIDSEFNIAYYKKSLEKAFHWLVSMQYSLENSFFVPQENLPIVLGGFRENYANFELWLDGAGHFILAAARFLKHKN